MNITWLDGDWTLLASGSAKPVSMGTWLSSVPWQSCLTLNNNHRLFLLWVSSLIICIVKSELHLQTLAAPLKVSIRKLVRSAELIWVFDSFSGSKWPAGSLTNKVLSIHATWGKRSDFLATKWLFYKRKCFWSLSELSWYRCSSSWLLYIRVVAEDVSCCFPSCATACYCGFDSLPLVLFQILYLVTPDRDGYNTGSLIGN